MSDISTRSLEVIGAEIRALTASMLTNVIEIGRRMVEAKELLPHGEFSVWIRENTGYSHSTANNFMRLFEEYGNPQQSLFGAEVEKSQTFGKLSYTKALALLALPTEAEREEFVVTHDVDSMSTRELQQAIRERDEAIRERDKAVHDREEAEGKLLEAAREADSRTELLSEREATIREKDSAISGLERDLEELKARPVEAAVQEPDPAEVERRAGELAEKAKAEAEKKAAAALKAEQKAKETAQRMAEDLRKKLDAAEKKLKAAEDKASDAGDGEAARAEIAFLKKQLAMSDAATAAARVHFTAWQEAYRKLREAVGAAPETAREKLLAAIRAQAEAWAEEEGA